MEEFLKIEGKKHKIAKDVLNFLKLKGNQEELRAKNLEKTANFTVNIGSDSHLF